MGTHGKKQKKHGFLFKCSSAFGNETWLKSTGRWGKVWPIPRDTRLNVWTSKKDHGDLGGVLGESDYGDIYGGFIVI